MLEQVLAYLNNWFLIPGAIYKATYTIEDGSITLPFLVDEQYFRVFKSLFNDGVYKYPATELTDETFDGVIWALAVPPAIITLASDIETWVAKYGDTVTGPYTSESFAGYSYTKKSGTTPSGDDAASWQAFFASRLAPHRKLR